ncbi:MAG: hypothetical protein AB7O59_25055 [Pirellulales bacterium]
MTRTRVFIVLALVVAAHAANDLISNPIGNSVRPSDGFVWLGLNLARIGVIMSQPLLLALFAVLWPAPRPLRQTVSLALLVLFLFSALHAEAGPVRIDLSTALFLAALYVVVLVICQGIVSWRRWRIATPWPPTRSLGDERFTLRGLLVAITLSCLLLALGRGLFSGVEWALRDWMATLRELAMIMLFYATMLLPAVFLVSLVLGTGPRKRVASWFAISTSSAGLGMLMLVVYTGSNEPWWEAALQLGAVMAGAYISVLVTLLVLRSCGFRLQSGRIEHTPPRDKADEFGPSLVPSTMTLYDA